MGRNGPCVQTKEKVNKMLPSQAKCRPAGEPSAQCQSVQQCGPCPSGLPLSRRGTRAGGSRTTDQGMQVPVSQARHPFLFPRTTAPWSCQGPVPMGWATVAPWGTKEHRSPGHGTASVCTAAHSPLCCSASSSENQIPGRLPGERRAPFTGVSTDP